MIGNLGGIRAFNTSSSNDKIGKWLEEHELAQHRDTLSIFGYTDLNQIRQLSLERWIAIGRFTATQGQEKRQVDKMNPKEALDLIMDQLHGNLWENADTTENELRKCLANLFKEQNSEEEMKEYLKLFPKSRSINPDNELVVDFRLCDHVRAFDEKVQTFKNYQDLLQAFGGGGKDIASVVGVSGCSKTSSLLKAATQHYIIFFEFGSAELNDSNLKQLIDDLNNKEYYQDYQIMYDKVLERWKIEILARMIHLLKLKQKHKDLTPTTGCCKSCRLFKSIAKIHT